MKIGVVRFPGTNNEHETIRALKSFDHVAPYLIDVWNEDQVEEMDGIYLPGGFSYGDYLRAGAIASTTSLMEKVSTKIKDGTPVLSICNGFQIVSERGLVDGVLLPNQSTRFICKFIHVKIPVNQSYLEELAGKVLKLPIAHFEGNLW
ncbi:MAG: phosphoribosylformylglycinamidine synthase I, partial [Methanobacteriota archaeon]